MLSEVDIRDWDSTTKNGMSETEKNKTLISGNMYETIPSSKKENVEQTLVEGTEYQKRSSIGSGAKQSAPYAVLGNPSTSITAMSQARQESGYVGHATSPSGSLSGQIGTPKQNDTWISTGLKYDGEKAPMALLDPPFLEGVAKVLGFGSNKYAAHNWRNGIAYSRLISAAYRHLGAINAGEDIDSESGLPHSYHLGCCIMFLSSMMQTRPDLDDRWKG